MGKTIDNAAEFGRGAMFLGALAVYGLALFGNKVVQQVRQGYYHTLIRLGQNVKYRKITEIDDPDAEFPRYVRTN